jgi:nucleotide-binding universal stress UspA family protein
VRTVLLDLSASEDADLLVLGSTGAGWFPALHLGHAAHYVAHHTDRPVAIVPVGNVPFDLRRVVIGVDGSSGSRAAVEFACQLGGPAARRSPRCTPTFPESREGCGATGRLAGGDRTVMS